MQEDEGDERIDHQGHKHHGTHQQQEKLSIAGQRVDSQLGDGVEHQAENAEGGAADDPAHHLRDCVRQLAQGPLGAVSGFPQGDAQQNRPGQNTDVIGVYQGVYRIGHQVHQQGVQHLADAAGGGGLALRLRELQSDRKQEAGDYRYAAVNKGAQQIEENDPGHVGLLSLPVAGEGGHYQKQHQQRGHRLQGAHEQIAQQSDGSSLGNRQPQHDANDQTAQDSEHQTALIPLF